MTTLVACATQHTRPESRFTGKERDSESGNDYFGARYYASTMGRFLSPDWSAQAEPVPYATLSNPQSLNLYAYVRNNPLTNVDLDGHISCVGFWCNVSGQSDPLAETFYEQSLQKTEQAAQRQQNAGSTPNPGGSPFSSINFPSTNVTGTFGPFQGAGGFQGASIIADPSNCEDCRWIQVVTSIGSVDNPSDNNGVPFVDGREVMGNNPTYPRQEGPANELNDQPSRNYSVKWTAVSVVGDTDARSKTFQARGGITWGFTINAQGHLSLSGPIRASATQISGVLGTVRQGYPSWTLK